MEKIILLIMILSFSFSLFARLGETLDQCKKRYKSLVVTEKFAGEMTIFIFIKNDFLINVYFLTGNKKAQAIAYVIPAESATKKILSSKNMSDSFRDLFNPQLNENYVLTISKYYVESLLAANANNSKWQKIKSYWVTNDANNIAYFLKNKTLMIMTTLFAKKMNTVIKKQKQTAKNNLKGF